jgi:hypothetical protein
MSIHSLEKCPDFIGRGQRIHLVDEETPRQSVMTCFVLSRFDPNTRRPDRFAKPFERSLLRIPILEYIRPIILAISVSPFQAVRRWPCVCSRSPPLYAGLDKIHYLVKNCFFKRFHSHHIVKFNQFGFDVIQHFKSMLYSQDSEYGFSVIISTNPAIVLSRIVIQTGVLCKGGNATGLSGVCGSFIYLNILLNSA